MARLISRQEAAQLLNVHPQTISNWVDSGILHGHFVNNFLMIDRKSIEQYFDTLEDFAFMEKRMSLQKKALKEASDELEKRIQDMSEAKHLMGKGVAPNILHDIFGAVLSVAGEDLLVQRETDIMKDIMKGKCLGEIADDYCLTRSRILQIMNKAIRKISTMKKWPDWHREYKEQIATNQTLTVLLKNQKTYIRQLELKLNIDNSEKKDGGESGVPGYSKLELAKTFGTRLVDENLSVRSLNCLKSADIETIGDLVRYSKTDLLKFRNFGKKSLTELDDFLDSLNLSFGMDVDHLIDAEVEYFLKEQEKLRR